MWFTVKSWIIKQFRFSKRAIAALAFLIVAGLVLWRGFVSTARRTVRLADGRELTIRQLTYGTNHEFVAGNALAKLVAPALPSSLKARTGLQRLTEKTDKPTVVVWGEWRYGKRASPTAANVATMVRSKREDSGDASNVGVFSVGHYGAYASWPLNNFPRRDRILHLEFCEWDKSWHLNPIAEFSLPNPVREKFPEWKAEPYPITKPTNGLEFSMVNFSAGQFIADPWLSILRHLQVATGYVATFRVAREVQARDNWKVEKMSVRDATGNSVKSRLQDSFSVGGYLTCGVGEALWPREQAWKFETEFRRASGFSSNEVCTMRGFSIPVSSTATQILADAEANGVAFIGVELQHMRPAPSMHRMREDLEIEPLLPRTLANRVISLAVVTDDQGRALNHDRSYFNLDGMHFGIELLPDSRTLDLTFAVQEPVVVQFVGGISERQPQRASR